MSSLAEMWSLVTVGSPNGGSSIGVQRLGRDEVRIPGNLGSYRSVYDLVLDWDAVAPRLRQLDPDQGELVESPHLLTPLRYPRKVLCSGPNFRDHLAEMGEASLGPDWIGYFFFKPPTTTLVGPTDPIMVGPDWAADRVDWEGELAVVIGRGGRDIEVDRATDHVAGYCVANDISLRGPHRRETSPTPFVWDWVASKAADTSLPLGPGMVPSWQVPDTGHLGIRTLVNGELKQNGTTADMVLDVAALIAAASRLVTLEPGDVIVTGTPAGVGLPRGTFLAPGDVVEVQIDGIGALRNEVRLRPGG